MILVKIESYENKLKNYYSLFIGKKKSETKQQLN